MFLSPKSRYGPPVNVNLDPNTIEQFAQSYTPVAEFAKPWERMSDQFGTLSQQDRFEDMLMGEAEREQLILDRLGL